MQNARKKYLNTSIYFNIKKKRECWESQFVQCRNWEWPQHSPCAGAAPPLPRTVPVSGRKCSWTENWSTQHSVSMSLVHLPFAVLQGSGEVLQTPGTPLHMGMWRKGWRSRRITPENSCGRREAQMRDEGFRTKG